MEVVERQNRVGFLEIEKLEKELGKRKVEKALAKAKSYEEFLKTVERLEKEVEKKKEREALGKQKINRKAKKLAKKVRKDWKKEKEEVKEKAKKYIVYLERVERNQITDENIIYIDYIGSFEDLSTAKAEAEKWSYLGTTFIVEDNPKAFYWKIRRKEKEALEKREIHALKRYYGMLKKKQKKYSIARAIFKNSSAHDEYYIVYYPNMRSFNPEKAIKSLFAKYVQKRSLNAKRDFMTAEFKEKRAKIPLIAQKVRKSELIALSKAEKSMISLRELL